MPSTLSPTRWANDITLVLNAVRGHDRFPVDVTALAQEYTSQRFPDDPIAVVKGSVLPGFDGALYRAPKGKKGWGIFYNSAMTSLGRISFTVAHEFGHYLLHRLAYPNGIQCGEQDIVRWDSEYAKIEHEANVFAANILMPFDDFRRQIDSGERVDMDMLASCAVRYGVSLIAATIRWLEYTERRAIIVVARDSFILWARSSSAAARSGVFFRTSRGPIELPALSLAARRDAACDARVGADLPPGVWFREACREMVVFSDQYDFSISLLQLDEQPPLFLEEQEEPDVYDRMRDAALGGYDR